MLGYRTVDNMGAKVYRPGDISCLDIDTINDNDAFTDTPIPSFYPQLDQRYPGSKFILTVRDIDAWLKSSRKQFNARHAKTRDEGINQIFEEIYGSAIFDEALFRSGYQHFVDQAKAHFTSRDDLLVIDVTSGDPWQELCKFLDHPIPDVPFPKANVTQISWTPPEKLLDIAQRAGDALLEIFNTLHYKNLPGTNPAWQDVLPGSTRRLYRGLHRRTCGSADKTAKIAYRLALQQIESGLRRITPDIPIISPETDRDTVHDQQNWNHFWLVDPLDGIEHFANPDAAPSINIALIQDRVPINAVIHAPTLATSYYAASWRPSLKAVRGVILSENAIEADQERLPAMTALEREAISSLRSASDRLPMGTGLGLCLAPLAVGRIDQSREWQTAAAQCILNRMGYRIGEPGSPSALTYNKTSFKNPTIELQSAD